MVSKRHSRGHRQSSSAPPQQPKAAINPYAAFYQQTSVTSPVHGANRANAQHDDDSVAVGIAMDTRNYQELLKAAAAQPTAATVRGHKPPPPPPQYMPAEPIAVTVRGHKPPPQYMPPQCMPPPPPPYPGQSTSEQHGNESDASVRFPILLGANSSDDNHNASPIVGEAVTSAANDDTVNNAEAAMTGLDVTVRGLPVDTRNYVAFGRTSASQAVASAPASSSSSTTQQQSRFPIRRLDERNDAIDATDDDVDPNEASDTVYGLPINTNNYEAIVGAGARVKTKRNRGFSSQAHSADGSLAERRASAPAFSAARSPLQYATAPQAMTTSMVPRGSCFEARRATTAAVVPVTGWLFAQSATLRRWKKHFAVLAGVEFRYSKGPGLAPRGFGTLQAVQPWRGMAFGLELTLTSGKRVAVHCANASEYEHWLAAFERALDKLQHMSGHSKSMYTLTSAASEQQTGYLFKQDARPATTWRRYHFVVRVDGFLECRVDADASALDARCSGYVKAVSFADVHPNSLAIELDAGACVLVYATSYDDRMLWYAALSSAALAHDHAPLATVSSVKASYVQTARANHAGWLHKQTGLFKTWKRFYFTLHGAEVSFSRDANAPVVLCDKVASVDDWSGKQHALEIRLASGRVWRVCADSYDSAKRWRTLLRTASSRRGGGDSFNVKKYVASRRRKGLAPVFGGWLTGVSDTGARVRQFYVVDASILGDASEVDHQLRPISRVVDIGVSRDVDCGLVVTFLNGSKLKLAADSVESFKLWYEIIKASL